MPGGSAVALRRPQRRRGVKTHYAVHVLGRVSPDLAAPSARFAGFHLIAAPPQPSRECIRVFRRGLICRLNRAPMRVNE